MREELKRLFSQFIIYGIGKVGVRLINFIMIPLYTRFLTPEDYGKLTIIHMIGSILHILFPLGLGSGLMRIYYTGNEKDEIDRIVGTAIVSSHVITLVFFFGLFFFSETFSRILFNFENGELFLRIIIITQLFVAIIDLFYSILRAEQRVKTFVTVNIFRTIFGIGIIIIFVAFLGRKVQGILEGTLISTLICYIILLPLIVKKERIRFSFKRLKEMLNFGLPLIPAGIALWIVNLSDRYFLKWFSSLSEVGLYSLGYNFGMLLQVLLVEPFKLAWNPFMFSVAKLDDAKRIYARVLVYFTLIGMAFVLLLSIFSKEILSIIATQKFIKGYKVIPLISLSYLLLGMCSILVAGIHIVKKTKYATLSIIITCPINLLLNYLLIPSFGMMGAAFATILSCLFLSLLYFHFSQKLYPIPHEFGRIGFIFITGFLVYILSTLIQGEILLSIFLKALIFLLYPTLLYISGFFKPEEIKEIRRLYLRFAKKDEKL